MSKFTNVQSARRQDARGFTLVELLVVVTIIIVLAAISVVSIRAARTSAWAGISTSNLRQCAVAIQGYAGDKGHFPECFDFAGGGPWSWQIRDYLGYTTLRNWPVDPVLHPRHGKTGMDRIPNSARPDIHHFTASAIAMRDVDESNPSNSSSYTRPSVIRSPETLILIGDAPLKNAARSPASGSHAAWWSLRFGVVEGNPEDVIAESVVRRSMDFWYRGRAHFLFADGHVEALAPTGIKKRHFQF